MGREHSGAWSLPIGVVRAARPSEVAGLHRRGYRRQSQRARMQRNTKLAGKSCGRAWQRDASESQSSGDSSHAAAALTGCWNILPQFDHADTAVIIVAYSRVGRVKERLSRFSKEEIGRAVSQVRPMPKSWHSLNFHTPANTLVRAEGSDETVSRAIGRDLAWERAPSRIVTANAVGIERDYMWSEPVKLAEDLVVSGVRFRGTLPKGDIEGLGMLTSPTELGEEKRSDSSRKRWIVEHSLGHVGDASVSPGSTFTLTLLEE